MNRAFYLISLVMLAGALACSLSLNVPHADTGPTETVTINEPLPPESSIMDVTLHLGAGTLQLTGGAPGLADGSIRYNVAEWRPTVTRSEGRLLIEQGETDLPLTLGEDVINEWDVRLGDVPMELSIDAGAYSGSIDLSGIPLQRVAINDGASDVRLEFREANPEEMSLFSYNTGASTVTLLGLGYANFSELTFTGGAGTYTLDFSGDLRRDADVTIRSGVSSVRIEIPDSTEAEVVVGGSLNNVDTLGDWTLDGDTYRLAGAGPSLRIFVDMGVGSLTLSAE
jgi:hypothetical protein